MSYGCRSRQAGAMNLYLLALLMMAVTLAALTFLYVMRYGQLPMQDVLQRWGKSGAVISHELKEISGASDAGARSGRLATVDAGIRRCTVKGKVIFSDVECTDDNPTTRELKLYDSKGGPPPKAPAAAQEESQQAPDLKMQMLDKSLK